MPQNYYRAHGLREPRLDDKKFHCPISGCGRRLYPAVTQSGARKDQTHLKCYNVHHKNFGPAFWHHFESPSPVASSLSSTSTTSTSHPPTPAALPSVSGYHISKCAWLHGCQSTRVNRLCSNNMCSKHCRLTSGRCPLHEQSTTPMPKEQPNTHPSLDAIIRAVQEYSSARSSAPRRSNKMAPDLAAAIARLPSPSPSPSRPHRLSSSASGISFAANTTELFQRSAVLVQWTENLKAPLVTGIQNPPGWPLWTYDTDAPYECYSFQFDTWMTVKPSYVHNLAPGEALLIRHLGVTGKDENVHIQRARTQMFPPDSPIIAGKTRKGKRRAQQIIELSDDDDIVVKQEKVSPNCRPHKRLRLTTTIPTTTPSPPSSPLFPASIPLPPISSHATSWKF
ncbi:hypothetical protein C8J57DRAFT_1334366 [Mycena rebaudengoi]|nr:hypothetical protein C8J57DRAFT_1334366 [Mycena rebaudengoi]